MKKHRVFIAINLPKKIKEKLIKYQTKWPELPIRWTKPENLHITLVFLGYISDKELLDVFQITKEVVNSHKAFSVNLKKIGYGPPKKIPPRMVWAIGEASKDIVNLREELEKSLIEKVNFPLENRTFTPHITLGRIRTWEWRQIEPEERPEIDEGINLSFEVNSIEVMESHLKRGGAEYTILESAPLG
ncbi:RNA 2',3'-cyclic phosphodiesterase [bacterium]|nr:RNA 2',3'-cyclic phosphodiesterase [bacterium]